MTNGSKSNGSNINSAMVYAGAAVVIAMLGAIAAISAFSKADVTLLLTTTITGVLGLLGSIAAFVNSGIAARNSSDGKVAALEGKLLAAEAAFNAAQAAASSKDNTEKIAATQASVVQTKEEVAVVGKRLDGQLTAFIAEAKGAAAGVATAIERNRGEAMAAGVLIASDIALAAAQAAPATGSPQEVVIIQPPGMAVPVELATPVPVQIEEVKEK